MVMFLFVIAYLGDTAHVPFAGGPSWVSIGAIVAAGAILVEIVVAIGLAAGDALSNAAEVSDAAIRMLLVASSSAPCRRSLARRTPLAYLQILCDTKSSQVWCGVQERCTGGYWRNLAITGGLPARATRAACCQWHSLERRLPVSGCPSDRGSAGQAPSASFDESLDAAAVSQLGEQRVQGA